MILNKKIEIISTIIVLGAVFSQYTETIYKVFTYGEATFLNETLRYWGYMTIWTNTLIGLIFLSSWLNVKFSFFNFFRQYSLKSAAFIYIFIVAVIYHFLLKITEFDSALSQINDFIFHTLTPALYMLYWIFKVPKEKLYFKSVTKWMLYPSIYALFVIIKGEINHVYPYFFFDVNELGYAKVLLYTLQLALFYGFLSYFFLIINNKFLASST